MPDLSRILQIGIVALSAVAALFCVIGLGTKGWYDGKLGLFCTDNPLCVTPPKGLSIIAFFLLLGTTGAFIALLIGVLRGALRFIPIVLLFISTIFLLATFTASVTPGLGYSFDLMVVAHFFSYVALAAAAYLYGLDSGSPGATTN